MIGLTPKQKKQFDVVVSFLTIGLLGLFAFIVALFLLTEISTTPTQNVFQPDKVEKGNYISERDIAIEKNNLPVFEEFPDDFSTSTPSLNETQTGVARIVTKEELASILEQENVLYPEDYEQTERVSVDSADLLLTSPTTAQIYVDPSSGVQLDSISIGYGTVPAGSEQSSQIRQGVVFLIDRDTQMMQLNSLTQGTQMVKVTPETKFFVNGKPIMFKNISETDVVYVEGLGYEGVSEIIATTVSIIGRFEINTESN